MLRLLPILVAIWCVGADYAKLEDAIAFFEQCVESSTDRIYNSDGQSICDTFLTTDDFTLLQASLTHPADYTADSAETDEYYDEIDQDVDTPAAPVLAATDPEPVDDPEAQLVLLQQSESEERHALGHHSHSHAHTHKPHHRPHHHRHARDHLAEHLAESHEEMEGDSENFEQLPTYKDISLRWPAATVSYSITTAAGNSGGANPKEITPWDQGALADLMKGIKWWEEDTCVDFENIPFGTRTNHVVLLSGVKTGDANMGRCSSSGRGNSATDEEILSLSGPAKNAKFTVTLAGGAYNFKLRMKRPESKKGTKVLQVARDRTTDNIAAATATAGGIQTLIDAKIGANQATVTGVNGGPFTIEFTGNSWKFRRIQLVSTHVNAVVAPVEKGGGWRWETGCPAGTYAHEFGHSMAFGHVMQRDDFTDYFNYLTVGTKDYSLDDQYAVKDTRWSTTAFPNYDDPRKARETLAESVMMYGPGTEVKTWDPSVTAHVLKSINDLKGQRDKVALLDSYQFNIYYQCQPIYLDVSAFTRQTIWMHPQQTLAQFKKKIASKTQIRPEDAFFRVLPNDVQSFSIPANVNGGSFKLTYYKDGDRGFAWKTDAITYSPNTELMVLRLQAALDKAFFPGRNWVSTGQVRKIEAVTFNVNKARATVKAHGVVGTPTLLVFGEKNAVANALLYAGSFPVTVVDVDTLEFTITTTPTAIASNTLLCVSLDPTFYVTTFAPRANPPIKLMTLDTASLTVSSGNVPAIVANVVQKGGYVPEINTLTLKGDATAGQYTLTVGDPAVTFYKATEPLAFNAKAWNVRFALGAVVGFSNVDVEGPDGGPYVITLKNHVGAQTTNTIRVVEVGTTMGGKIPTIAQTQPGVAAKFPIDDTKTLLDPTIGLGAHAEFSIAALPAKPSQKVTVKLQTAGDKQVAYNEYWTFAEFVVYLKKQYPTETINRLKKGTVDLPPSQTIWDASVWSWDTLTVA